MSVTIEYPQTPICYAISLLALSQATLTDSQTVYWGGNAVAPTTTADQRKIIVPRTGRIVRAACVLYCTTAGTNEAWSMYIRKNNTTDYLIETKSASANERIFQNFALAVPIAAGDYLEIKEVFPAWATNPATCVRGGTIFVCG